MQELEENFKKNGGSFEKYKIGELFIVKKGKRLENRYHIAGKTPFIGSSALNNGITDYIDKKAIFNKNAITVSYNGSVGSVFFQEHDFWASDDINILYLKDKELNVSLSTYISAVLKKAGLGFSFNYKWNVERMVDTDIILPTLHNELAFDYMQDYVRELEQDYVRELDAYLKVTGLDNYELTEEEKKCIELKLDFKDYILSDLFTKKTVKGVPKSEEDLTENKSGFLMYGQNIKPQYPQKILLDEKYLQKVEHNQPILGYTSSVGEIGMIEESFYRSGNNGAFQGLFAKEHKYNKYELLYVLTILRKYFNDFGYATSMANIIDLMVKLPIKQNAINYSFMENYIKAIEKLVIKDLVDWKNKEIETAKEVVNN